MFGRLRFRGLIGNCLLVLEDCLGHMRFRGLIGNCLLVLEDFRGTWDSEVLLVLEDCSGHMRFRGLMGNCLLVLEDWLGHMRFRGLIGNCLLVLEAFYSRDDTDFLEKLIISINIPKGIYSNIIIILFHSVWNRVKIVLLCFLKSPWKLKIPWKVLQNHSKTLKSTWFLINSERHSPVNGDNS